MEFCVYVYLLCFSCAYGGYRQTNQGCGLNGVLSLNHCLLTSKEHHRPNVSFFFFTGTEAEKFRKLAFFGGGGKI